jgi:hypothetical protein
MPLQGGRQKRRNFVERKTFLAKYKGNRLGVVDCAAVTIVSGYEHRKQRRMGRSILETAQQPTECTKCSRPVSRARPRGGASAAPIGGRRASDVDHRRCPWPVGHRGGGSGVWPPGQNLTTYEQLYVVLGWAQISD